MEEEDWFKKIVAIMKVNLKTEKWMVMEFLRYLMESNIMAIGGKEEQYAQMKKTFK